MKKGFTLIELLAVILILGIIAVIAVPTISSIVSESRRNSFKSNVYALTNKISNNCNYDLLVGNSFTSKYDFSNETIINDLGFSSSSISGGYATVNDKCEVTLNVSLDEKFCAIKDANNDDILIENYECLNLNEPIYSLKNTTFNGSTFIDTGIKLFDTNKNFTILVSFKSTTNTVLSSGSPTLFHCLYETSPYPGLAFDQQSNIKGRIAIKSQRYGVFDTSIYNTKKVLAITRNIDTGIIKYYTLNSDGETFTTANIQTYMDLTNFNQNLIIGAYQNIGGTKGRYFIGEIYDFYIYNESIIDSDIKTMMYKMNET